MGEGRERALEDVKCRGVVIVVDGVRGNVDNLWPHIYVCAF